jgi:hypothetical protein
VGRIGIGVQACGCVCGFGLGEVRAFFFCSTVALGIGVPCCMLGRIILRSVVLWSDACFFCGWVSGLGRVEVVSLVVQFGSACLRAEWVVV